MIFKIQPSNPNFMAAIEYNEQKAVNPELEPTGDVMMKGIENGRILATRNVPEGSTLASEFERLQILNQTKRKAGRQLKNLAFHMSVNPSETDKELSNERAVKLIDEVMDALGYAKQPYRIYEHNDIARRHFHVVSCRAGQDGKKVNADFEIFVLRKKLKELSKKYGFTLVLSDDEKEELRSQGIEPEEPRKTAKEPEPGKPIREKDNSTEAKRFVPAFSRKSETPVLKQIQDITKEALTWHFSTYEQMQALLLRRFNVLLEIEKQKEDSAVFFGTDIKGTPVTPPISEQELHMAFLRNLEEKIRNEKMRNRRDQRKRVEAVARGAAERAKSYDEFLALMERKGVILVLSWNHDGEPFGLTYLDKATKCAWKGSETASDLQWLLTTVKNNGWTITKDKYHKALESRKALPSRQTTMVKHDRTEQATAGNARKQSNDYLPGHHQSSRARVGKDKDDIWKDEEDVPQELVQ